MKLPSRIATVSYAILICLGGISWWYFGKGPVGSVDGFPFPREVLLPVPHFAQADLRWGGELLGGEQGETLAEAGCAVSSAAMVLAYKGADVDPGRLNSFLRTLPGGYTSQGWIEWYKAAEYYPLLTAQLLPHYEGAPSRFFLDWNLLHGNPVIVRLKSQHSPGFNHFMVVVGKRWRDYLVQDPGGDGAQGVYPLKNYSPYIDAIRFYRL